MAYIVSCKDAHLGIVEFFSGDGHTTSAGVKRSFRGGINCGVTVGFDLMVQPNVELFWDYLRRSKPGCVVMAPPCTAFGQRPKRNRLDAAARVTWLKNRVHGMRLAKLSAHVARSQITNKRLFVIENPHGSGRWKLPFSLRSFLSLLASSP